MGITWDAYPWTSLPYYFSKCWVAYVTISIATHVLYATICIATRIDQCTRVSFKKLACHTRVAYINSCVHLDSTLKNINHDLEGVDCSWKYLYSSSPIFLYMQYLIKVCLWVLSCADLIGWREAWARLHLSPLQKTYFLTFMCISGSPKVDLKH